MTFNIYWAYRQVDIEKLQKIRSAFYLECRLIIKNHSKQESLLTANKSKEKCILE